MHATKLCQKVIPNGWAWKLVTILANENESPQLIPVNNKIKIGIICIVCCTCGLYWIVRS